MCYNINISFIDFLIDMVKATVKKLLKMVKNLVLSTVGAVRIIRKKLFTIAADKSFGWGYEGAIHGVAANEEVLRHYMDVFHAEYLGMLHQYQFLIDEEQAKNLVEVYHYEWNET